MQCHKVLLHDSYIAISNSISTIFFWGGGFWFFRSHHHRTPILVDNSLYGLKFLNRCNDKTLLLRLTTHYYGQSRINRMNTITSLEVLTWRLGGATTWQTVIVSTLTYLLIAFSPKFAPANHTAVLTAFAYGRTWLAICGVLFAMVPANFAFVYLLSNEKPSIRYRRLVVLCLPVPLAGFVQNLLTRLHSHTATAATFASILLHCASAWLVLVQAKYLLRLNLSESSPCAKPICSCWNKKYKVKKPRRERKMMVLLFNLLLQLLPKRPGWALH